MSKKLNESKVLETYLEKKAGIRFIPVNDDVKNGFINASRTANIRINHNNEIYRQSINNENNYPVLKKSKNI